MANKTWTEVKEDTTGRMEFHLGRMYEAIKMLENSGLDVVAKKIEDAHKMMVKDLNEKWTPTEDMPIAIAIIQEVGNDEPQGMKMEDVIKEMEKQAKRNSRVGDYN